MDTDMIKYAMRRIIEDEALIDLDTRFQGDNDGKLATDGLSYWIQEVSGGQELAPLTDMRLRPVTLIVHYNIYAPKGSGTNTLSSIREKLLSVFPVGREIQASSTVSGVTSRVSGTVRRARAMDSLTTEAWHVLPVRFTLTVVCGKSTSAAG